MRLLSVALVLGSLLASATGRADDLDGQPEPQPGYPQGYPNGYPVQPPYAPRIYTPVYGEPLGAGPEEMDYVEGTPIPYGYTRVEKTRKGLVIGGAITLGIVYSASAAFAAVGEDLRAANETRTNTSAMWIPVAGPFLQMKETSSSTGRLALFHIGLAQTAGALMLVYGLTSPRTLLVRNDQLSVVPMLSRDATGAMVSGRF